jgi:ferric-dicitrate binding protein FerR (iron transport regulator)
LIHKLVDFIFDRHNHKDFVDGDFVKNTPKEKSVQMIKLLNKIKEEHISQEFTDEGLNEVWEKIGIQERSTKRKLISSREFLKYVATIIFIILTGYIGYNVYDVNTQKLAYTSYITNPNQNSTVKLIDGTVVFMKENSCMKVPNNFSETNRHLEIEGEAYLEVKHNPKSVFRLKSDQYEIKVLGTKFNLRNYPNEDVLTTTLNKGVVVADMRKFTDESSDEIVLKEYQKLYFNKKTHRKLLKSFNKKAKIFWKDNSFKFYDMTFEEIVKTLSLYFNKEIVIASENLKNNQFRAKFSGKTASEILDLLKITTKFNYIINKNKITITETKQ